MVVTNEQECKHKETQYYYSDHARNNEAFNHVCDMMVCIECGAETKKCVYVRGWWHQ